MPGSPPKYDLPVSSFKNYKRSKAKDSILKRQPGEEYNVNPSARVYPYNYTPKHTKYGFVDRIKTKDGASQLLGVAGVGFPKEGINLDFVGIRDLNNNPYWKGLISGEISQKLNDRLTMGASFGKTFEYDDKDTPGKFSKVKQFLPSSELKLKYNFEKGGFLGSIKNSIGFTKKFIDGGPLEGNKNSAYEYFKNSTQPVDKFGNANVNYQGPTTFRSLSNQVNAPIPTKADELTNQYGYDYKKTYDESGTPHYYTKKEGADSWIDLETKKNKNQLAAVKALTWGDDTSYIGTDAHLAQRQNEYDKQLKSKGTWLGPMEAEERKKLYNIETDKEAPNMILSYAQDSDFINSIANFATISPGNVNEKYNSQIKRALLKGTHGFNPATGQLIKLSSLGDAGQSRVVDTKSLNDPYLNYTLEGVEGEMQNPDFYNKRYKTEQKASHKNLTDYINKRHLVHLAKEDAWRGHMGAYPVFAEDVYTDDDGNAVFKDQGGMEKRFSGNAVDLYNYGNRDVYMTDAEEEAYRKEMLLENNKVMWDSPMMDVPGLVFSLGMSGAARQGIKQGAKHLTKKFLKSPILQSAKKGLTQPLLTHTAPKYAKYMLSPMQWMDVAGAVYGVNQFRDPNSTTRQSIRDYQQGKGSFGNAAFNTSMSVLSGVPVGAEMARSGYGNLVGGINALRRVPQISGFKSGMGQVLKGEAKFKDLFNTQKYSRFTKAGNSGSSKDLLWYQNAKADNINKYFPSKGGKASDIILTDAQASEYNAVARQNKINSGKQYEIIDDITSKRSIAKTDSPEMIAYMNKITDPKTKKLFQQALDNPDKYWKLPGYTDDIAELVAKAPASKDEITFTKDTFKNLKAFDAEDWSPNYNLLDEFSGSYLGAKSQAFRQSKRLFDFIGTKASKLSKVGKIEQAGYDEIND